MTTAEEIQSLSARIDELKAKAAREQETGANQSTVEKLLDRLSTLSAQRVSAQRETKFYPLWKPLDMDSIERNYGDARVTRKLVDGIAMATGNGDVVTKANSTTGVAPLIRQDLDPEIYEIYVKRFPLYDLIEKIPANGLVHAWNQETSYGDAPFMSETGTVTDDQAVYARLTANIAIIGTRRGISLKAKYAVSAGGMNYDPEAREIAAGIRAIAHKSQAALIRYQDTNSSATTATDPNGLYDVNAYNGLRYLLQNVAPAGNTIGPVDVTAPPTAGTHPVTDAVQAAANAVMDAGGEPNAIICSISGRQYVISEQTSFVRFDGTNSQEIMPGVRVPKIVAGESELPLIVLPGDSMGTYIESSHTYIDLYVVDMDQLALAYLGQPNPTVLEIPIGTDGTLRQLYIPFIMNGLVAYATQYLARVQLKIA